MADLRIALELDDSQYTSKIQQAGVRAQEFGDKARRAADDAGGGFDRVATGIDKVNQQLNALAAGIIGVGIIDFVRSVLQAADAADEMAGRFGFAVQSMLELSKSAAQAGIGAQDLNTILTKFVTNAEDAVGGNEKLQAAFKRLGVSMSDLRNLSPEESFAKLVGAIADSPNRTQALAAAMDILGKQAAKVDFGDLNTQIELNRGTMASQAEAAMATGEAMRQLGVFVGEIKSEFLKLLEPILSLIGDEASGFNGAKEAAIALATVLSVTFVAAVATAFSFMVTQISAAVAVIRGWKTTSTETAMSIAKENAVIALSYEAIEQQALQASRAAAQMRMSQAAGGAGGALAATAGGLIPTTAIPQASKLKELMAEIEGNGKKAAGGVSALNTALGSGEGAAGRLGTRLGVMIAEFTGLNVIVGALRGAFAFLTPLLGAVVAAFGSVGAAVAAVAAVIGAMVGFVLYAFPEARAAISGWVTSLIDGFKWLGGVISDFVSNSLDWLISKWDAAANAARRALGYQEIDFAGNREKARGRAALEEIMSPERLRQGMADLERAYGGNTNAPRGFIGTPQVGGGGSANAAADAAKRAAEEARRKADAEAEATAQLRAQLTTENASFNRSVERIQLERSLVGVGELERNRRLEFFDAETQYNEQRAKILEDIRRLEAEGREEGAADRSARIAALNEQLAVIEQRKNTLAEERSQLAEINRAEELRLAILEQQRSMQQSIQALQDEYADMTATEDERRIRSAERSFRAQEEAMLSFFRRDNPSLTDEEIKNLPAYIAAIDQMKEKQAEFVEQTRRNIELSREFSTGWERAMRQYAEDVTNEATQANNLFTKFAQGWEDAFVRFAETGKLSFKDLVNTILIELVKIQAQKMFVTLFGQGGILGGIGSLLGFADGGEPPVGRPSIVGERGPELFIPKVPGTIVPNQDIGRVLNGGQPVVHNTYITNNVSAIDAKSVAQLFAENRRLLLGNVEQARKELPSSTPMR